MEKKALMKIPWESPKIPFRADIRTRSKNNEEVFFLCNFQVGYQIQEYRHVIIPLSKIKGVSLWLMQVPGNIPVVKL